MFSFLLWSQKRLYVGFFRKMQLLIIRSTPITSVHAFLQTCRATMKKPPNPKQILCTKGKADEQHFFKVRKCSRYIDPCYPYREYATCFELYRMYRGLISIASFNINLLLYNYQNPKPEIEVVSEGQWKKSDPYQLLVPFIPLRHSFGYLLRCRHFAYVLLFYVFQTFSYHSSP